MELEGAAYLYALVAAAMTFVGFSAIVIILRQTMGATLSPFQLLLTQLLVEHGFVVVFLSLLPLLLTLFGIRHELVWQLSSAIAVFAVTVWLCNYLWRRYPSVRTKPQPGYVRVNMAIQTLTLLALLGNAVGLIYRPSPGVYAAGMSWILVQGADIFLLSLKHYLRPPHVDGDSSPQAPQNSGAGTTRESNRRRRPVRN